MKKLLVIVLAIAMLAAFAGCEKENTPAATAAPVAPAATAAATTAPAATTAATPAPAAAATPAPAAAEWAVKIGDFELTAAKAAELETITQTLKKVSKDGSMKDQSCTGYTIASVLELAGVTEFAKITAVAADGFEYELTKEAAALGTTILVIEQDGEKYTQPRLAVDGEGSKAWLKDVVEFKIG